MPLCRRAKAICPLPSIPEPIGSGREFYLLRQCCVPSDEGTTIRELCPTIRWKEFERLARRHQVEPLVYKSLSRFAPEWLSANLRRRALAVSARALQLGSELVRINHAFAHYKIDRTHIKGILLSLRLFGEVGMRDVRDLDLMVRPRDLVRAAQLLKSLGYQGPLRHPTLTQRIMAKVLSHDHHLIHRHLETRTSVELHWRFYLWSPEQVDELWNHRTPSVCLGGRFPQLDDDALLLVLCGHGAGHRWSHLKWLVDVATFLTEDSRIRWSDLILLADKLNLERALAQAALLSHWLFGIPLPEPLSQLIHEDASCAALARTALTAMLREESRIQGRARYWRYFLRLRTGNKRFRTEEVV